MNTHRPLKSAVLLIGLLSMLSGLVYADRDNRRDHERYDRDRYEHRDNRKFFGERHYSPPPKGYIFDKRFNHNQYYPKPGYRLHTLPRDHYRTHFRDHDYYYHGGIWYSWIGGNYIVIRPPLGLFVPVLPAFYTTIWFGGIPYYYANDVYYVWDAGRGGYIVTNPPEDVSGQQEPPVMSEQLYVYPKQGQSEKQQANDRYACHTWSVKQTGFDPTQPPTNESQNSINDQREAYRRAMRACLEGKGYSVR